MRNVFIAVSVSCLARRLQILIAIVFGDRRKPQCKGGSPWLT
jgi:hypothetical protein